MPKNKKARFLIFVSFIILFFIAGCGKEDLSDLDNNITCYAATYGKGIYKSDNGGTSWYPLDIDQEDLYLYFKRLFLAPDSKTLYVGTTGSGLFTINLELGIIEKIDQLKDENIRTVAFYPRSGNSEIFSGMFEHGIFKYQEGSGEWTALNQGLSYRDVNTLITHGDDLLAGTVKGVFMWNNNENTWKATSEGIENKNIISIGSDIKSNILYAGAGVYEDEKGFFDSFPCLYKSTDNGKTWDASDSGIPDETLVYDIAVNPSKPERVYLGTSDGIYRSIISGRKWYKMEDDLPDDFRVFDIKILSMSDEKDLVYAAGSKGIFVTTDDDKNPWADKSYGLPSTNITSIEIVPFNG